MAMNAETQKSIDDLRAKISSGEQGFMGNAEGAIKAITEARDKVPPVAVKEEKKPDEAVITEAPIEPAKEVNSPVLKNQELSELEDRIVKQADLIAKQKTKIDLDNAEKGKIGRTLKEAVQKMEKLEAEMAALKKPQETITSQPVFGEIKKPIPPVAPIANKDEDMFDESFIKKQNAFIKDQERYNREVLEYYEKIAEKQGLEVKKSFEEKFKAIEEKANSAISFKESSEQNVQMEKYRQEESLLFNEIESLQSGNPELKTSTPVREINSVVISYDVQNHPENKVLLDAYFATLPKEDVENYQKIVEIGSEYKPYNSENGSFRKNLKNIDEAYLLYKFRSGELKNNKQKEAERIIEEKRRTREETINAINGNGVSEIPPNKIGSSEGGLELSREDMVSDLNKYNAQMNANPVEFTKSDNFRKRNEIMSKLGIPIMRR